MESGAVLFVNLTQKPTSCTLHAYMQESSDHGFKPNAELYTRQYSFLPRPANSATL